MGDLNLVTTKADYYCRLSKSASLIQLAHRQNSADKENAKVSHLIAYTGLQKKLFFLIVFMHDIITFRAQTWILKCKFYIQNFKNISIFISLDIVE